MAVLMNKAGVQHYANKMVKAENRKVGDSLLSTALTDIDTKLTEMKTIFDEEYGSELEMELENDTTSFAVGTGINIDKRDEMLNGFSDIEIKGNSLVNLNTMFKGCSRYKLTGWYKQDVICLNTYLEPNKKYTLTYSLTIHEDKAGGKYSTGNLGLGNGSFNYDLQKTSLSTKDGIVKLVFEVADFREYTHLAIRPLRLQSTPVEGEYIIYSIENVMLLEGDYTDKELPSYFEGISSVGELRNNEIEVSSIGENLWDGKGFMAGRMSIGKIDIGFTKDESLYEPYGVTWTITGSSMRGVCLGYMPCSPNQFLTLSFNYSHINTLKSNGVWFNCFNSKKEYISTIQTRFAGVERIEDRCVGVSTTNTPMGTAYVVTCYHNGNDTSETANKKCIMTNIKLEYGKKATSFTIASQDKKQISLEQPLRGIPTGAKDSIEKIDGEWKLVRRCGQRKINNNSTVGQARVGFATLT